MNAYKLTLDIYPIADCGANLDKGEPITMFYVGFDLDLMKSQINEMVLRAMKSLDASDGETFVELSITKNGQYYDHDEATVFVDLNNNTITYEI